MTSDPVKGPSPSDPMKGSNETKTSSSPHRKIEKVEKVGEVDPEQQSRARKFRSMVDDEGPEESANSQYPSPIDLFSTDDTTKTSSKPSFSSDKPAAPIPNPSYSPPPAAALGAEKEEEAPPLPRSNNFWADVDEPALQEPSKQPALTENPPSFKKKENGKKQQEEFIPSSNLGIPIKKEISPYELIREKEKQPNKKIPKTGEIPLPSTPKSVPPETQPVKESALPTSRYLDKEEKETVISPIPTEEKKTFDSRRPVENKKSNPPDQIYPQLPQDENIAWAPANPFESKNNNEKKKEETAIEVQPPSAQILPVDTIPIATAATAAAMPYLKPETMSLFYQMVGTIHVMTSTPGVSRTEIVLNAASYTQSKFYGASIIIEKYASAPDSFNIRLTGSNEAVTAFNQNIPNLMTAFQKGNFSFGIGRIEAEYKDEKPIFRRKERREENDLSGGFTDKGSDQ